MSLVSLDDDGQLGTIKARLGAPSTRLTADSSVRVASQAGPNQTAAEEEVLDADSGDWQGSADS